MALFNVTMIFAIEDSLWRALCVICCEMNEHTIAIRYLMALYS